MRGGKRKGSGRKAGTLRGNKVKTVNTSLPIELCDWLDHLKAGGQQKSKIITNALYEYRDKYYINGGRNEY